MTADNDIVERLRALSRCEHGDLSVGDEAAAEIVRLRGEVPAGEAVAYLDIGVGGYLDLGTEKDDDELFKLPLGRHMLGIIGTHGVDGYKAHQPAGGEAVAWREVADYPATTPQATQPQGGCK